MEHLTSLIKLRLENQGIEHIHNSKDPNELLIPSCNTHYRTPSVFNHAAIVVRPNQIILADINNKYGTPGWITKLSTSDPELLEKVDQWVNKLSEMNNPAIIGEAPPISN